MPVPIGPYARQTPELLPSDPRAAIGAARVASLINAERPDLVVEHIGSTSVPGLPGKGILDLGIAADPADIPGIVEMLYGLGFQPQPGPDPWPPTRPMLVGSMEVDGLPLRIHCHVQPGTAELRRDLAFRDALRGDPALLADYTALKSEIVADDVQSTFEYTFRKQAWIVGVLAGLGYHPATIDPPATIGILGGGQLGRMLAIAARAMGYRIAVLDPDPACPAAAVADVLVLGTYDDVGAALRLAERSDVITYELEHVAAAVIDAVDALRPVRPGRYPLVMTQDRLAERRFVEAAGIGVAPWREVRTTDDVRSAAAPDALGLPLRLKAPIGGYDGRGQIRVATEAEIDGALARLGRPAGTSVLAERELVFEAELSVIVSRGLDGIATTYPIARNVHDAGILSESVAPAPVRAEISERAAAIGRRLAVAMGLVGTLTAELFLLPDGSIVVNELAPRVHNSGHWTIEGAATSQFEQHIRAICGLGLGSSAALSPTAMVNLLGTGPLREARLTGTSAALVDPDVHLHLYDKRRVFERRKMGHVTALGATVEVALERAKAASDALGWAGQDGRKEDR
jgi:5-(carboxyamino)imidazole ribonucleotide synthase